MKEVIEELEKTGLPYEIKHGTKHRKIIIAGRLACVITSGRRVSGVRGFRNTISSIRKMARTIKA